MIYSGFLSVNIELFILPIMASALSGSLMPKTVARFINGTKGGLMNERIKELRKALGLTMEKFGERLGVKKNTISQLESGKNALTDKILKHAPGRTSLKVYICK